MASVSRPRQTRRTNVRNLGPGLPTPNPNPAPARSHPEPAPQDTCTIPTFKINGVRYHLCGIARQPGDEATRIYLVSTSDGDPEHRHHVCETPWGCTCDCGDFCFRRDGIDPAGCKHIKALARLGFLTNVNAFTAFATPEGKGGA